MCIFLRYWVALSAAIYTFLVGFTTRRGRRVITAICAEMGIGQTVQAASIEITDLIEDFEQVTVLRPASIHGNIALLEMAIIIGLVRERSPMCLFEIGTFDGRTTLNLAEFSPDGAIVYTMDLASSFNRRIRKSSRHTDRQLHEEIGIGTQYRDRPCARKIRQLIADSTMFDFTPYHDRCDLIFVDGSHHRDAVHADSLNAWQMCQVGGIILWHDYGASYGATAALNALIRDDRRFNEVQHVRGTTLAILGKT